MSGAAILLTNDSALWAVPQKFDTVDAAFRIHAGRLVTGHLSWGASAAVSTKRGREERLTDQNESALITDTGVQGYLSPVE